MVVARVWEMGNGDLFHVFTISVWDDDKVLEMDSGEGCKTRRMYSVSYI